MTAEQTLPRPVDVNVSECPYIGLVPFTAEQGRYFFGRDRDIDLIAANVQAFRLTLLYGPSGVGKSSVIGAGVVPLLRRELADEPTLVIPMSSWRDDPSRLIDVAAMQAGRDHGLWLDPTDPSAPLGDRLRSWAQQIDGDVYCIFDQFEDYFLYHEDPAERFGRELAHCLAAEVAPAHFLVSLREDALGKLDRFRAWVPNLYANQYRLEPLGMEQAREAICGPLQRYNDTAPSGSRFSIEPALVDTVLAEVRAGEVVVGATGEGRVAMAVERDEIEAAHLQLVMTRLWQTEVAAGSSVLRMRTLGDLGGSASIVRSHLDATMERLPEHDRDLAAAVFGQLVTPSGAKIAHSLDDLADYADVDEDELAPVLEHLADGSTRVLRGVPPAPNRPQDPRYEIFHDALAPAILDWRQRRAGEQQLEDSRRSLRNERRRRGRLAILLCIALALLAATGLVLARTVITDRQRQRSLRLAAEAVERIDADPTDAVGVAFNAWDANHGTAAEDAMRVAGSSLLATGSLIGHEDAILAVDATKTEDGSVRYLTTSRDGSARVWDESGVELTRAEGHEADVIGGAFSPDGSRIVTWSSDRTIRVSDAVDGRELVQIPDYSGSGGDVDVSADGRRVAAATGAGDVMVVDGTTGESIQELDIEDGAFFTTVMFHPMDPNVLFTGDSLGWLRSWSITTGEQSGATQGLRGDDALEYAIQTMAVSADGTTLAGGTTLADVVLWRWADGPDSEVIFSSQHGFDGIADIAFAPDGSAFVASGRKATVLWRLDEDDLWIEQGAATHVDWAQAADFAPNGEFFVSVSRDGTGIIADGQTGRLFAELLGDPGDLLAVVVAPDGTIVTGADDGTARIWSLPGTRSFRGHDDWVIDLDLTDDASTAVTAGTDGTVRVWDVGTGEARTVIDGIPGDENFEDYLGRLNPVAVDATGDHIAAGNIESGFERVWVWQRSGDSYEGKASRPTFASDLAFRPNATVLAIASNYGDIELWDWTDDSTQSISTDGEVAFVEWSGDGRLLAAGLGNGDVAVWDARTRDQVATLTGHSGQVWDVAFSPDGQQIASAGQDGTARIWDLDSRDELRQLRGHDVRLASIDYSGDGRYVVTGDADGIVGMWDAESGRPLARPRAHADSVNGVEALLGEDGSLSILSVGDDAGVRLRACTSCRPMSELIPELRARLAELPSADSDSDSPDHDTLGEVGTGDCLAEVPSAGTINVVDAIDCEQPHAAEIVGTPALAEPEDEPLPPPDDLMEQATETCGEAFADYVGIAADQSSYDMAPLVPTGSRWSTGDRTVTCVLLAPDTTGSAKGAAE